jgi:hypothetical protein
VSHTVQWQNNQSPTYLITGKHMLQRSLILISFLSATLLGCGSVDTLNPFDNSVKERSKIPENSTQYICEGNKEFFVRMLNNGKDAWLIYPDHEVNLSKADDSNTYKAAAITLELDGDQSKLTDGDKVSYTECKAQVKK